MNDQQEMVSGFAAAVGAFVGRFDGAEVEFSGDVGDEAGQMILGQPIGVHSCSNGLSGRLFPWWSQYPIALLPTRMRDITSLVSSR